MAEKVIGKAPKTPRRSNLDMMREPLPNRWMSRSGSAHTMIVQRLSASLVGLRDDLR
jgi:hypothetical protein